jgi:hypothetical protein
MGGVAKSGDKMDGDKHGLHSLAREALEPHVGQKNRDL